MAKLIRLMNRGIKISILASFASVLACGGASTTPNNLPKSPDQVTADQKEKELEKNKAALDKEAADIIEKQKETLAEQDQIAADRNKLEVQKTDLEKLKEGMVAIATNTEQNQSELGRAVGVQNKLIQESKDPLERMAARLALGMNVPILVQIVGSSADQLHGLENELAVVNTYPKFYSELDQQDPTKVVGIFAAILNSVEKLKTFKDYANTNAPKMKVVIIPIEKVLARSYIQLSYRQGGALSGSLFTKRFWIGDSPITVINNDFTQAPNFNDVASFIPYLKDCDKVTEDCLKTLVGHNYFKNLSWIDGRAQEPLVFLEEQLGETSWLLGDEGYRGSFEIQHPKNSTVPLIDDVTVINTLWVISDLLPFSELSEAYGTKEASYLEQIGSYGSYKSPVSYESHVPSLTGNKNLDMPVIVSQLHSYICTVTPCLEKK